MPETYVHENELNVRIASILSESFGLDCRAERTHQRRRPDIKCFHVGFRIVIEGSYSRSDAESDARKRLEEGSADIAVALHYTERYPDIPEEELEKRLRESVFNAMILVPREVKNLERYILSKTRVARTVEGWYQGIRLGDLADIVRHAVAFLVEEVEIQQEVNRVKAVVEDFVKMANALPGSDKIRGGIVSLLYKLYGFEVAETRDAEVVFGQSALAILLSSVLYERVRHLHKLPPLRDYVNSYGPINGLLKALETLKKINYEPALELAIDILNVLPPVLGRQVQNIIDVASRISQMSSLLARDFAGRIYHEITGDIAVRKGFATFYTEIPAAYMLSNLAIKTLLDIGDVEKLDGNSASTILSTICKLKIVDFACGSGTLLTSSLNIASRLARNLCFLYNLECLCRDGERLVSIEKNLVENGIYGLDALRYASQITALNLALITPEAINKENVVAVYLGVTKDGRAWLGSLELLDNARMFGGLLRWIEGGLKVAIEAVSTTSIIRGKIELPDYYDVVIMNPPFTRATGRVGREFEEERKGLFGFITGGKSRDAIKRRYDEVRKRVREELKNTAIELAGREPVLGELRALFREREKRKSTESVTTLTQYLNIGQAGEGLLFLYLAYKYVRPGGVIAFVLPRNLLSGVSWFLARVLLASKFHVKYIVVSSDPERGYNFSEGTGLSECLVVARRTDIHSPDEETVFVNLLRKPKSALEATVMSDRITTCSSNGGSVLELPTGAMCILRRVDRRQLLENLDNWNRHVFLPDNEVVEIGLRALKGDLSIPGFKVPITRLIELVSTMGVDRHQFHDNFKCVNTVTPYPVIFGGEEEVRKTMLAKPNAYVNPTNETAGTIYKKYSGRALLPDRIRLNTAHVLAMYTDTPVLSNIFYAVKLKELRVEYEKALVYWLNTTWGLLSVIASREETEGPWISLKMALWKLLPVLDVSKLGEEIVKRLSKAFDEVALARPRRIVEQFSENPSGVDPVRLRIDLGFLKSVKPDVDENKVKEHLYEIYRTIAVALRRWIRAGQALNNNT